VYFHHPAFSHPNNTSALSRPGVDLSSCATSLGFKLLRGPLGKSPSSWAYGKNFFWDSSALNRSANKVSRRLMRFRCCNTCAVRSRAAACGDDDRKYDRNGCERVTSSQESIDKIVISCMKSRVQVQKEWKLVP